MASEPKPKPRTASAIVTVTLEIEAGSSWGKDCTVQQVHDQASRETMQKLSLILHLLRKGVKDEQGMTRRMVARVVEKPKVKAVIVEDR